MVGIALCSMVVAVVAGMSLRGAEAGQVSLSKADLEKIISQAETAANDTKSLLRVDGQFTKMHIIIVDRDGMHLAEKSMSDAWVGSYKIAFGKARTAALFSSDGNALTSRSIGELSQSEGALWNIGNSNITPDGVSLIEFAGSVPLYKDGVLVGAIGVSGDHVDLDELVAIAGAIGFEPLAALRIDTVLENTVSYTKQPS